MKISVKFLIEPYQLHKIQRILQTINFHKHFKIFQNYNTTIGP